MANSSVCVAHILCYTIKHIAQKHLKNAQGIFDSKEHPSELVLSHMMEIQQPFLLDLFC